MNTRKITQFSFVGCLIVLIFLLYANVTIGKYSSRILQPKATPTSTVAIIFGGGMKTPTEMSDMQYDRVFIGVTLYKNKTVQKLFLTGDDGAYHHDEISAMAQVALANGVAPEDLLIDPHGYRTYDSCWRETKLYGIRDAIVVSQSFHLPRITYLCESMGMTVVPVSSDYREYDSWWIKNPREWLARVKAVWQVSISRPEPRSSAK